MRWPVALIYDNQDTPWPTCNWQIIANHKPSFSVPCRAAAQAVPVGRCGMSKPFQTFSLLSSIFRRRKQEYRFCQWKKRKSMRSMRSALSRAWPRSFFFARSSRLFVRGKKPTEIRHPFFFAREKKRVKKKEGGGHRAGARFFSGRTVGCALALSACLAFFEVSSARFVPVVNPFFFCILFRPIRR